MAFKSKHLSILTVTAAVAALVPLSAERAHAQGAAGDQAATAASLEEVVVTAQRRKEKLQDVPMSIDVASGEQIQKLNLFDAKDVQRLSPGLELTNNSGRNNRATLRGIAFDPDQGTSPAVDIYLNEIPIDAQTALTAIYDLEQVEVLRGPQGALRGRTSPGGAITFRTRRPRLDQLERYAQVTAGNLDTFNVQGGVSVPLIPGKLAVRFAAVADGNQINHVTNPRPGIGMSKSRTQSGRVTFEWAPTDTFGMHLMYQYLKSDNRQNQQVYGPGNAPALVPFGDPTLSGPSATGRSYLAVDELPHRFLNKTNFVNLGFDWSLGAATLSFNGGYQRTQLDQSASQDEANAVPGYTSPKLGFAPFPVSTAELRLVSNDSGMWGWSVGAFYSKQSGTVESITRNDTFFGTFPASLGLYLPVTVDVFVPVYSKTTSLAASGSARLSDQWKLEVAARYSDLNNKQSGAANVSSPGFPGMPAFFIPAVPAFSIVQPLIPAALQETHEKPLTGAVTLTYAPNPAVTAYLAYGRAFRAGTAGVSVPANISADLIKTSPEKSDAIELGLKTELLDRRLTWNTDVFLQKFSGYIFRTSSYIYYDNGTRNAFGQQAGAPDGLVDGSFPFNYNADAKIKGIETSLIAHPSTNWDVAVNAAWAQARFDNASIPCNDFAGTGIPNTKGAPKVTGTRNVSYCRTSDRLGITPDFSLSANTEVRIPTGAFQSYVRALATYRPGFFSSQSNFDYPAQTLVNLYAGIRAADSRWDFSVYAKNLLDQQKITYISLNQVIATAAGTAYDSGYRLVNVTQPREVGVTASFSF